MLFWHPLLSASTEMPSSSAAVQRQASADIPGQSVSGLTSSSVSNVLCSV